jgi:hypothetical protein
MNIKFLLIGKGNSQNSKDAAAVRANRPIPRSCIVYYFEITVVSKGQDGLVKNGILNWNNGQG